MITYDDYRLAANRAREGKTRAACPRCGYSQRLRRNGWPFRHYLYAGGKKFVCPGGEVARADLPPYPVATFLP